MAVFPRAARLDVQHLQARLLAVATHRPSNELRAIVAANVPRHAARQEQAGQYVEHPIGCDA